MKKLLFLLIITTSFCYSQEGKLSVFLDFDKLPIGEKITIYYNNEWRPLVKKDSASFYREITFKDKKIPSGRIIDYYSNGVKQNMFYASYVGLDKQGIDSVFIQGPSTRYYENSNKSSSSSYLNNNKIGEENNYNEFGKLVATNNFEDGILQGEQIFYYESGEVETKRTWANGLLQGEQIYYKTGQTKDTISGLYIEGKIDYTKLWLNGKIKERRIALVIGNANYNKGILENPVNDATLIAESLKKLDFEVLLHTNLATEDAMLGAIKDFGRKRKNYEIGFVYYAGHGVQLNNQNYLLPTKEVFEYEEDVEDNAVSMQRVLRYLEASREGQLNFVVLDACRDNPFESNWNKTRSLKGGGLAKTPPPQGSLIAYSTDHGQTAADGNGENSMYSKALASNLLVKGISIEQVFKNVRTEVLKLSKNKQSPVEESKLTGEVFYMNKKEEK